MRKERRKTKNAREASHELNYALSYELLRAAIREQSKSMPRSMVAALLGVTPRQLRFFMSGGHASDALHMAAMAFEEGMLIHPPEVELEAVALNLIADTFPTKHRPRVRRALADAIRPVLRAEGRELSTL